MHEETYTKIQDVALQIEKFRELDESEKEWLIELLKRGNAVLRCLELLETIEGKAMNYYELGAALGCSWQTAKQRLNALISGGASIKPERDGRYIAPKIGGRPRKLVRK